MAVGDTTPHRATVRTVDPASLPSDATVVHVDQLSEAEFERFRQAVDAAPARPATGVSPTDGTVVVATDYYWVRFD